MPAYIQINMHNTHLTIAVHVLMHLCCVCKFQVANMLCGKAQRWLRCTVDVHRSHLLSTGARRILVRKTFILVNWAKMTGPSIDLPKEVCMFAHRLVDLFLKSGLVVLHLALNKHGKSFQKSGGCIYK